MTPKHQTSKKILKLLSLFEAAKGLLVLLVGAGLLTFIHQNTQQQAAEIVRLLHLNPARHYPEIFITTLTNLGNVQFWMLSASALLYSLIRFAEAYGLWNDRLWAIWFGVASGGLFLPMELYELSEHITFIRIALFLLNIVLVFFLFRMIRHRAS
ncbi:MAG: DUF2127 domain-containing protein [Ignavibacteriae bacterium]|nr:MAG: DUF2127 domain-containing protein [Ignavibacteriota bacterium]